VDYLQKIYSDGGKNSSKSPYDNVKDKEYKGVFKRTNRQNIILQLLKKKPDVTIKDITQYIKDCSEKTIQRELIALISVGVLKRTGERRWSKYSLA
jgi:predicted HTH transcriptional regulator